MLNSEQRTWLAVGLSVVILLGSHWFFSETTPVKPEPSLQERTATVAESVSLDVHPSVPLFESRESALKASDRASFSQDSLVGSVSLKDGAIDDVQLKTYRKNVNSDDFVCLLSPMGLEESTQWVTGWRLSAGNESSWAEATPSERDMPQPLLMLQKKEGDLVLTKKICCDQAYHMTVIDQVKNEGTASVSVRFQNQLKKQGEPKTSGAMVIHEGLIGCFGQKIQELTYAKAQKKKNIVQTERPQWFGFTDREWLTALLFPGHEKAPASTEWHSCRTDNTMPVYDLGYGEDVVLQPGESQSRVSHAFFGPKELPILEKYQKELDVKQLDSALDFGWFYIITKPLFYGLSWIYQATGSFAVSLLLLTLLVKMAFWPLASRSQRSMAKMKALQPKLDALKKRFGEDRVRLSQETMALYQKEKINPVSGCLPMALQIPVFFALYKVFFISIDMRHAPFWGWIQDLSAPDPTSFWNLFGLLPWEPLSFSSVGAWPILMGITMILQQKLTPAAGVDPAQRKILTWMMPVIFTSMLSQFPVGLVIYWTWSNLFSIAQQLYFQRKSA